MRGNTDSSAAPSRLAKAAAHFGLARANAAEWTDVEKANVKVVTDFLAARWGPDPLDFTKIGSFLADDCIRAARSTNFTRGRDAIIADLQRSNGDVLSRELKILQTAVIGPIVITERIENQRMKGRDGGPPRDSGGHVVGFFEVRDGKIKEWRAFGF